MIFCSHEPCCCPSCNGRWVDRPRIFAAVRWTATTAFKAHFQSPRTLSADWRAPRPNHRLAEKSDEKRSALSPGHQAIHFTPPTLLIPTRVIRRKHPTFIEFRLETTPEGIQLLLTENGFDQVPSDGCAEVFHANAGDWSEQMKNIEIAITAESSKQRGIWWPGTGIEPPPPAFSGLI